MKKHIYLMNDNEEWLPVEGCVSNDNSCGTDEEECSYDSDCSEFDIVVGVVD